MHPREHAAEEPVSIHAPVKERHNQSPAYRRHTSFNSRSREGATEQRRPLSRTKEVSIHAPVKERPFFRIISALNCGFNSRSREGATCRYAARSAAGCSFNSRSREGATRLCKSSGLWFGFNSRSREGATYKNRICQSLFLVSIHAPVKERHGYALFYPVQAMFQFTLP